MPQAGETPFRRSPVTVAAISQNSFPTTSSMRLSPLGNSDRQETETPISRLRLAVTHSSFAGFEMPWLLTWSACRTTLGARSPLSSKGLMVAFAGTPLDRGTIASG